MAQQKTSHLEQLVDGYQVSSARWLMQISFSLCLSSSAYMMLTFAPISKIVASAFGVSDLLVNTCVIVFLVCSILFNFIASKTLETLGLSKTFKACAIINICGVWGRYMALKEANSFHWLVVSQTFVAAAQPFLLNGVSKVATQWMPDDERALATALGSLAIPIGNVMGFMIAPFYITEFDATHQAEGQDAVQYYMLVSAFIVTVMSSFVLVVYKDPTSFPSKSAEVQEATQFDFKAEIKDLATNPNYVFIAIAYMMCYGYYTAMGALMSNILTPFGYTSLECSIMGICFLLCGLLGSFLFSYILDKTKKFKFLLQLILFLQLLFVSLFYWTGPSANFPLLAINGMLAGFVTIPVIPVAYTFAVELTHPVSEALSNGMMMLLSQIIGIGVCYIGTHFANQNPLYVVYMFIGQLSLAFIASFFIKEDLRRVNLAKLKEKDLGVVEAVTEQTEGNEVSESVTVWQATTIEESGVSINE